MAAWSSNFEDNPQQSDSPSEGDDAIRELKVEVRERMENEHTTYSTTGSSGERTKDFIHRPGSARAYYQSTEPTTLPNGNALTSETDITKGTLWVDSDTDRPYVWDGSAFKAVSANEVTRISLQGDLFTGTDLIPPVIFPEAITISKVSVRAGTSPTGTGIRLDLNRNSNTSIFSTTEYIEISAGGTNATTTSAGLSTTHATLAADDYLTLDVDQIGSTVGGGDVSISIVGYKS